MDEALGASAFSRLASDIDGWLGQYLSTNDAMLAVDQGGPDDCGPGERRWYVRLGGEQKEFTTVWLTLGQRTLRYDIRAAMAAATRSRNLRTCPASK